MQPARKTFEEYMAESLQRHPELAELVEASRAEEDFGNYLEQMRTKRGLTQRQLQEKSGVQQSMIARLERGSQVPKLSTMLRLMEALDAVCLIGADHIEVIPSHHVLDARVTILDDGSAANASAGMSLGESRSTQTSTRKGHRQ